MMQRHGLFAATSAIYHNLIMAVDVFVIAVHDILYKAGQTFTQITL